MVKETEAQAKIGIGQQKQIKISYFYRLIALYFNGVDEVIFEPDSKILGCQLPWNMVLCIVDEN